MRHTEDVDEEVPVLIAGGGGAGLTSSMLVRDAVAVAVDAVQFPLLHPAAPSPAPQGSRMT